MIGREPSLENEGGLKSRWNQQVARSVADMQIDCIDSTAAGGEGGGGSRSPASPSFLVHNKDNVNAQLYRAESLLAMWDFLEYKGRIGRTHVILHKIDGLSVLRIMPTSCRSRYFDDGRLCIASRACQYRHYAGYIQSRFTRATRGGSGKV